VIREKRTMFDWSIIQQIDWSIFDGNCGEIASIRNISPFCRIDDEYGFIVTRELDIVDKS
jgi:hypothetical protein